jgi:hypothetical protein
MNYAGRFHARAAPSLAVLLGGCLSVPDAQQVQCTQNSDCNTSLGEVCDHGLCWGGPPAGQFAAIVVPPSDRADLISVEHPMQALPTNGDLGNVALDAPVTISGRIEPFCVAPVTCASTTIAATVTVTRDPLFAGGPGFKAVVSAKDGLPRGSNSFSISVPRTNASDPDYIVTIVPDGNGNLPPTNGTTSAAELAPPGLLAIRAAENVDTGTIILGAENSAVVTGTLVDGASHMLSKYRVVVRGRLSSNGPTAEVSTIDYTPNGQFSVTLSPDALPPYTIEARPYDQNVVAPTLYLTELDAVGGAHTLAQPSSLGNKKAVAISVQGLSDNGEVKPVGGAHVIVTGTYDAGIGGAASAVLSVDATTGDNGLANLTLLDGASLASTYKLRVVPAAGSSLGAIYDRDFSLTDTTPLRLATRISLSGRVIARDGTPAGKIAVTARPSLRFAWSVDPTAQEFLGEIPAATAVTNADGGFSIAVDPSLATVWGRYDLDFVSPNGVDSTAWTVSGVEIPHDASLTSVGLGDEHMPDTAYMHGHITDPSGFGVAGGELRVFRLVTDTTLCTQVPFGPAGCPIPAALLGHASSDANGAIRLALPR